jgi:hypothetical protein
MVRDEILAGGEPGEIMIGRRQTDTGGGGAEDGAAGFTGGSGVKGEGGQEEAGGDEAGTAREAPWAEETVRGEVHVGIRTHSTNRRLKVAARGGGTF